MAVTILLVSIAQFLVAAALALGAFDFMCPEPAARLWIALGRRRARLVERRMEFGGTALPYLEGGSGAPLLLLHGFGADKDNFSLVAPYLTEHLRLIVPDLPGFGAAPRDRGARYRIEDQVARLREFVQRLGLPKVHLGGSSMGGFIAAQYAASYPDEVGSLWLLGPAGTKAALDTDLMRRYLDTGEIPLLVRTTDAYAALLKVVTYRPTPLPHSLRHVLSRRAAADFALHARIFKEVDEDSPLLEPVLPAIAAPTLIVWGAEDLVLSASAAAALGGRIRTSEVIVMPKVGHLPMVERPRTVARDYLRFRARLTAGTTA